MSEWKAGRWYRVLQPDGSLWMETSDPDEAIDESQEKGYAIDRLWVKTESEWRPYNPVEEE